VVQAKSSEIKKPAAALKNPEAQPFDPKKRKHSKSMSILEGSMNSASVGFTSNFITPFALALGSSNTIIAMLSTLPSVIGAVVQLLATKVSGLFKSRKQHIVFFAVLQAVVWLPMLFAPQLHAPGGWLLLFVTLNAIFGMLIGPIWNSFMSDVVEEDERGRFFGLRNTFTGLTAFVSTFIAGWILNYYSPENVFIGFSILFVLSFVFRLLSAYFLAKMDDPPEGDLNKDFPDIPEFIMTAEKTPFGRFVIFLVLFNIAVAISSPFFGVYELSILKFDYLTFTLLECVAAICSFITMLFWGKYVDRIGSKNVLVTCGFLIPLVPFLWTLTTDPWRLVLVEIFSGTVWAGFNLSVSTYLFDATDRKNRAREIAEYTLLVQVASFLGAMLGSGLLGFFDRTNPNAYITIFILSAVLRLAVVLIFFKTLQEMRLVEIPVKDRVFKRFIAIKPHQGIDYQPAVENVKHAGRMAYHRPNQINEEMKEYAGRARGQRQESAIKRMERQEDEQDFKEYQRKLKK
jgi:MFS family permease